MSDLDISPDEITAITAFVDTAAPPPDDRPTALFLFGTNQSPPADIAAERYHLGLAPLVIVTGGVNRHNGIVEGEVFRRLLLERGVADDVIRVEARSANTPQNVEFALPYLEEALAEGLTITAVTKWYHRRTVEFLKTLVHGIGRYHCVTFDPVYDGEPVTRESWPRIPAGRRRVVREWQEVRRRVADGSLTAAERVAGAWK